MASNGRFQPGQSGNPATQFKPGNRHRWQRGQSGNPAGVSRNSRQLKERFKDALRGDPNPEKIADLLCELVRGRRPRAFQRLLQRLGREAKEFDISGGRENRAAVKLVNDSVVLQRGSADDGERSRAKDPLATPAVESPTRAHDADVDSLRGLSVKERYEEFCRAKVKAHVMALPPAVRSLRFDETRSAIRRAVPQLRRDALDEIAQREFESTIRARLHLPTLEEFTEGCI